MKDSVSLAPSFEPAGAGGHHRVLGPLGRGGMAGVYRVVDASGTEVALKRLSEQKDEARGRRARLHFEREFHTLSQLAHPRVIEVYDYGVDDVGPYYTMELLDGGDLREQAPLPWQAACGMLRDVCSALSLLHSRQLIHRDISPHNVRCTAGGQAKLLDFGAMAPMGAAKDLVGTPPICAPEVVNLGHLDARADLYSVGCTLYFALVGKHAFPAAGFGQLPLLWGTSPPPPSEMVDGIPPALDALVMSLVSLDRDARPGSAAEVMDRLGAIAGLPSDEQLPVSYAYLSSPRLVGRDPELDRLRQDLQQVSESRGCSLMVVGGSGVGRSRLLDAASLEARFCGLLHLRADAADGREGEGGVLAALARQLLRARTDLAMRAAGPHLPVLGHLVPELLQHTAPIELARFENGSERQPRLHRALRAWLEGVSAEQPLALVVDDVDRADDFSAAGLAMLAHRTGSQRLAVLTTADDAVRDEPSSAMKLLLQSSGLLRLANLASADTESLVRSVFGDVPHVAKLAAKLHRLSGGNPRDVMGLARHLVDGSVVRYASGAWSVPSHIDEADLPASMAEALFRRACSLDRDSIQLARVMALAPELSADMERLQLMTGHAEQPRLLRSLGVLLSVDVLRGHAGSFELSQRGWATALFRDVSEAERRASHLRLAEVFLAAEDLFRAAQNLFRGGEPERGLDALLEHACATHDLLLNRPEVYSQVVQSLPGDWLSTYREALRLCEELGRPARERYSLYNRAASVATGRGGEGEPARALLDVLSTAAGLDLYHALPPDMDPKQRMITAFQSATQRHAQLPEASQVMPPKEALASLARAITMAAGVAGGRMDLELLDSMPSVKPFAALSPALQSVELLREGLGQRLLGQSHLAHETYARLLQSLKQPGHGGLEATHAANIVWAVSLAQGLVDAIAGSQRAMDHIRGLEEQPLYSLSAVLVRMVYHLFQGDVESADRCRQEAELARLHNGDYQYSQQNRMAEVVAFAAMDDLVRLQQSLEGVRSLATTVASWVPVQHFGRGEYHRIRGAKQLALQELKLASKLVVAGRHPLYCEITGAYVRALQESGDAAQARSVGMQALADCQREQLDYGTWSVCASLAVTLAKLGERMPAEALAERALTLLDEVGAGTLLHGRAHEARARVALALGDRAAFETHFRLCEEQFTAHNNHALLTRLQALRADATRAGVREDDRARGGPTAPESPFIAELSEVLSGCTLASERAQRALEILVEYAGAEGALLYAVEFEGPRLCARVGVSPDAAVVEDQVRSNLVHEARVEASATATGAMDIDESRQAHASRIQTEGGDVLHYVLVAHAADGEFCLTGMVVFRVRSHRPFTVPTGLASRLSRCWMTQGESSALSTHMPWTQR